MTGRWNWMDRAACAGEDLAWFFPVSYQLSEPAVTVCRGCSVRTECLRWVMSWETEQARVNRGEPWRHGIFAGLTPTQRQTLAKTGRPR